MHHILFAVMKTAIIKLSEKYKNFISVNYNLLAVYLVHPQTFLVKPRQTVSDPHEIYEIALLAHTMQ